jgi:hypothetical protein
LLFLFEGSQNEKGKKEVDGRREEEGISAKKWAKFRGARKRKEEAEEGGGGGSIENAVNEGHIDVELLGQCLNGPNAFGEAMKKGGPNSNQVPINPLKC